MATIQPFKAIRPSAAVLHNLVFQDMNHTAPQDTELSLLKHKLEPGSREDQDSKTLDNCSNYLHRLLASGQYKQEESPAIYIYETTQGSESQTGIWALTDLEDSKKGCIITHEHTFSENEEQIKAYREQVGLEGTPILLTYHPQQDINDLIEIVKITHVPECIYHQRQYHRIWKITLDTLINQFQSAFQKLGSVYVADGHHRLAAALALHQNKQQWISSLYIPTSTLKIKPFHRMVIPESEIQESLLIAAVSKYYFMSAIPNNRPYCPDQKNRMGLYSKGTWYQLDLKKEIGQLENTPDVRILQEKILAPVFGIDDPRTDTRLFSFPAEEGWKELLSRLSENTVPVAFTLFPMTAGQLVEQAESHAVLPPKSTWIEPKVPFGLLMYCSSMASLIITDEKGG